MNDFILKNTVITDFEDLINSADKYQKGADIYTELLKQIILNSCTLN